MHGELPAMRKADEQPSATWWKAPARQCTPRAAQLGGGCWFQLRALWGWVICCSATFQKRAAVAFLKQKLPCLLGKVALRWAPLSGNSSAPQQHWQAESRWDVRAPRFKWARG